MKAFLCVLLLSTFTLQADEASDRAAIDKAIVALNDPAQRADLFTRDADSAVNFEQLVKIHRRTSGGMPVGMSETWSQLTVPKVVSGNIRFLAPDIAMVDGASEIEGAMTLARRVPLLFVMKKEGGKWLINAVRVLSIPPPSPPPPAKL